MFSLPKPEHEYKHGQVRVEIQIETDCFTVYQQKCMKYSRINEM